MQEEAVRTANEALDTYSEDYEVAAYLRRRFDKLYKPVWHCFVGRSFGGNSKPDAESTRRDDVMAASVSVAFALYRILVVCIGVWALRLATGGVYLRLIDREITFDCNWFSGWLIPLAGP
ncbi:dynein light chain 1 cytoplasmic [Clonorchis sinensis]|nr:dynein light chain 1 cytoplasmic [Clonorchis sinensis]